MTKQDTDFTPFAGQLVAGGSWDNPAPAPVIGLEGVSSEATLQNLQAIHGLMQKIAEIIIHEPKVFSSPLEGLITKYGTPYGVGIESMAFMTGAANKKNDGTCIPRGDAEGISQLNFKNFTHNIDISIFDKEVNNAVLNAAQVGAYVAAKMRLPAKTMGQMKYRSTVQLLSDVVDGTRTITSYINSNDPNSTAVSYSETVSGYAGDVETLQVTVPPVAEGSLVSITNAADATTIIKTLQGVARDFAYESDAYNKLGIDTFCAGKPVLIMEAKTLDAMDNILALDGTDKRIPTRDAREYMRTFADIREIDSFASLPTNTTYTGQRLLAVMADGSDLLFEGVAENSVEGQRCSNQRMTGYNYRYESTIGVWRGANSYAMLCSAGE